MAGLLAVLSPGSAQEAPQEKLRAVEQQLGRSRSQQDELTRQAEALALELGTLRAESVKSAEAAQAHETMLSTLEAQLQSLTADETQKRSVLARDRAHEAELLSALARLALNPPEALALGPLAPEDAIRSGILLGNAVPRMQQEASALNLQLGELRRLRAEIERKRQAADAERRALASDRARLDALIQRKAALRDQALQGAEATKQRLAKLSTEAGDLHDLIERLEAERKAREEAARLETARLEAERVEAAKREAARQTEVAALPRPGTGAKPETVVSAPAPVTLDPTRPKTIRPFGKAQGAMVFPASGVLARRYGEADEFGVSSKGLTLVTRPGAVVVAPFDGRIEFAGPFKGYGQILIIQHGDGYHSLLAGLNRIDGTVGDWLVAGEPVGAMVSGEPNPRLYLELRHNGQPINPLPWLATRDEKVSG
jgi:septal ring factor EnvC (AmiA/AmiB activator)